MRIPAARRTPARIVVTPARIATGPARIAMGFVMASLGISCALGMMGCQADHPGLKIYDVGLGDALPETLDKPASCRPVEPNARITELALPNAPTSQDRQPIRGRTVGSHDVFVRVGSVISEIVSVRADGTFCIEVPLAPNTQNAIEVVPRTSNGCWGQSRPATITHRTAAVASAVPVDAVNVAQFKNVTTTHLASNSDRTNITDGQSNTFAEISFLNVPNNYAVVTVDLAGSHAIGNVVIEWAPGTTSAYARKYTILMTDDVSPGTPNPLAVQGNWVTVVRKDYAAGNPGGFGTQQHTLSPRNARWIALVLYEDAGLGVYETFHLAQIKAFAARGVSPGTTQDTCP